MIMQNIIISNKSVFNVGAQTIVNAINTEGIMGKGIALEFRLRFPEMYYDYQNKCKNKEVIIGEPYLFSKDCDLQILNFPTKKQWKYPSKIEWISSGLSYLIDNFNKMNIKSIAFPMLGTNNGELDPHIVKNIMIKKLSEIDIQVFICLNTNKEPEGLEQEMVIYFNNNFRLITNQLKCKKLTLEKIESHFPILRFNDLLRINKISLSTYERLFIEVYDIINSKNRTNYSLF